MVPEGGPRGGDGLLRGGMIIKYIRVSNPNPESKISSQETKKTAPNEIQSSRVLPRPLKTHSKVTGGV